MPRSLFRSMVNLILAWVICLPMAGYADDMKQVKERLIGALTCRGNPIHVVDDLIQNSDHGFRSGYAAARFGEGTAYRGVIVLRDHMEFAGAQTQALIRETESSYFDFEAVVYARFKGDYHRAVTKLRLLPIEKDVPEGVVQYQRKLDVDIDNLKDQVCPMTIYLRPLEGGAFLLGCGWCNG